jgi:hypothetical protein
MTKNVAHAHRPGESNRHERHDPLERARNEAPTLNLLWLKHGEKQTLNQKIGFTILSLLFIGAGIYMAVDCIVALQEADVPGVLLSAPSAVFLLTFGVLGSCNVLRFKQNQQ